MKEFLPPGVDKGYLGDGPPGDDKFKDEMLRREWLRKSLGIPTIPGTDEGIIDERRSRIENARSPDEEEL